MRIGHLPQIEIGGSDVAEHEALDAETIIAAFLDEKSALLEGGQQPERGSARDAGTRRELGERQAALLK